MLCGKRYGGGKRAASSPYMQAYTQQAYRRKELKRVVVAVYEPPCGGALPESNQTCRYAAQNEGTDDKRKRPEARAAAERKAVQGYKSAEQVERAPPQYRIPGVCAEEGHARQASPVVGGVDIIGAEGDYAQKKERYADKVTRLAAKFFGKEI